MLISSKELSSQDQVIRELKKEGYKLTQATLSRDLKQLKVAKAASMSGKYVYVLPNDTMYKRINSNQNLTEMLRRSGYRSVKFSGQIAVLKTKPGYASAIAYDIDNSDFPDILGTIAGDDTIFIVTKEGSTQASILRSLSVIVPEVKNEDGLIS